MDFNDYILRSLSEKVETILMGGKLVSLLLTPPFVSHARPVIDLVAGYLAHLFDHLLRGILAARVGRTGPQGAQVDFDAIHLHPVRGYGLTKRLAYLPLSSPDN